MSVAIKEVITKKELKEFVTFLYKHYKENKFWVPPLMSDELKAFDREKNPVFGICRSKFWLAYKDNVCVGRVCGIIIPAWIEKKGEKLARFTRIEFIDDPEVSTRLFDTVENWAKEEGMDGIVGPLGFSNLDQSALLIEGHDWLPSIASNYQWDYYQKHFDNYGYTKEVDWLEFRITFPDQLPEKSYKVAELLKSRYGLKYVGFNSLKELLPFKKEVSHLYNDAFSALYGTYPLPDNLLTFYFDKYFPNLNPKYVKIILDREDKLVGFVIAMPSLAKAMQKAKGRLFPFGFIPVLKARKKNNEMDLMLTGVRPEMQKMGVAALLMNELWLTANADGIKFVETTGMLEDNHVAIQMWKSFDHIQHKRKRCYRKMF
jgi:GNAT superfamily N-acetyltransferase